MSTDIATTAGAASAATAGAASAATAGQQQGGMLSTGSNIELPAYLKERRDSGHVGKGLETLAKYYVPPRLKIIQAQTKDELKSVFGEGSVIVTPANIPVAPWMPEASQSGIFTFIPIMTFTEWGAVNPRNVIDKETGQPLPFLRERTTDPRSDIAVRANNFKDKNRPGRTEPCPEKPDKMIRYCEFINFLVLIENVPDLANMPVLISFWSSGHKDGRMLANILLARAGVDMFAQRFQAFTTPRSNNDGNWKGLTVQTPTAAPAFVQTAEECDHYGKLHDKYMAMYKAREMQAEYDETDDGVIDAEGRTVDIEA